MDWGMGGLHEHWQWMMILFLYHKHRPASFLGDQHFYAMERGLCRGASEQPRWHRRLFQLGIFARGEEVGRDCALACAT